MALALDESGDRKAAIKAYKRLSNCPGLCRRYNNLASRLAEGMREQALKVYQEGMKRPA